ncbi:MAG: hypothetical protein ACMUIU_14650 [bacterium]
MVRTPHFPEAFIVELPELRFDDIADKSEIRKREEETRRWLDSVRICHEGNASFADTQASETTPEEQKEPIQSPFPITKRCLDYLVNINDDTFRPSTKRDKKLRISQWMGNKIRQELADQGLISLHRVSTGIKRKIFTLTEITEDGYKLLEGMQVRVKRPRGSGGYIHQFWEHTVYTWCLRAGFPAKIEDRISEKNVDVGIQWNEKRCAVEILIKGIDKELSNLAKDISEGWDQIIFCAEKKETIKKLKQKIRDHEQFGQDMLNSNRVAFMELKFFVLQDKSKTNET